MTGATFWLGKYCARHPRISGGVVVLLRHLNTWLSEQRQRECSLDEFRAILEDQGLCVSEVAGTLLVSGLGLAEDLEYYRGRQEKEVRNRSTVSRRS